LHHYGRIILAGGLTPENVREAIHVVRPYAVDVCSGVEAAPGTKDWDKVRAFVRHAREPLLPPQQR
jgi:phosphoribosylanthranilate isomerase